MMNNELEGWHKYGENGLLLKILMEYARVFQLYSK